jgi:hypothetical protein
MELKAVFDFNRMSDTRPRVSRSRGVGRSAILEGMSPKPDAQGLLVREVELPRRTGVAGPILALVAAGMVTLMTAIAVTSAPPRPRARHVDHRTHVDTTPVLAPLAPALSAPTTPPPIICGQRVYRATEGRPEQFEDCAGVVR